MQILVVYVFLRPRYHKKDDELSFQLPTENKIYNIHDGIVMCTFH